MSGKFSACLLIQSSDGTPEFSEKDLNLQPGRRMITGEEDVLLAGGFSTLFPETGFPLSPTLQLNKDFGDLSHDELEQVALAELERVNTATYRSYLVEPDNRLCVIGNDSEKLESFVDDFGGVLEIEPILLKGSHPEIVTAVELEVSHLNAEYQVRLSVQSPINIERCTYCGDCGSACPEDCLDEQLHINYSVCTSCKECEKACVHDAIDIHGVEERVLKVPALLLMDGVKLNFEGDKSSMYTEDGIRDFLSNQFSYQVDEVITCSESICQYSAKLGHGCSSCTDVCKYGAISRDNNGIKIDPVKCEECGGCIGACPTGAIQYERFSDGAFISYLQSLDIKPGTTLVMGSEAMLHKLWWRNSTAKAENTFFLEYNRVSGLSFFHLLYLFARGFGRVILLTQEGETESDESLRRQTAMAASLLNTYFEVENRIVVASPREFIIQMNNHEEPLLPDAIKLDDTANRRQNLAHLLEIFSARTGRQARIKENRSLPFATISCDGDKCTQCYACLNDCRIEALHTDEEKLSLRYNSSLCVGCAICVRVCPENALKIISGATIDKQFFDDVTMAEAEPMRCKECGKVFGTRKSYQRVMEILSKKESVDTSHFEYCDTCRVVKLFEDA
ncbi:4Fe-4S binding protein [Desulfopila sp. IMCC35008]|uniref:4Fe-4S binding protein n=1 Tax=Desulfopila sp. IMCC35008 TaxID=2653858 RepID=UPI0013D3F0EA|nr:4Fe-4S binding protein [Desulfopila sp. IMCC35008]